MRVMKYLMTLLASLLFLSAPAFANDGAPQEEHNAKPFGVWSQEFKAEASAAGVSEALLSKAFAELTPNNRVVELDRKQPENTKTFSQYLKGAVNDSRITKGRALLQEHSALLREVSAKYGVKPRFIIALWGIETNFGGYTGDFSIVRSLATLAYDGRRADFFRKELLNALKIIDEGHISLADMEGSWAGAMGQCQFMPSSFLAYAVDHNGDGRKDIWGTLPDVFASIANYLSQSGWNDSLTWGREVRIPGSIDEALLDGKHYKSLNEWQALGVRNGSGGALPSRDVQGALTVPGSRAEPTYLIYSNYDVLLKWNRSRYFATAVGLLSDAIAQ